MPLKHSIAVLIPRGDEILTTRRSLHDDELAGIWGLPAGTFQQGESVEQIIERIGRDKLGVLLRPVRHLCSGTQSRERYFLTMDLWEASMEGDPTHPEWRWAPMDFLQPGAAAGSLCCELALIYKKESRVN